MIATTVVTVHHSLKSPQIELPLKRSEFGLFEKSDMESKVDL
jgi:hypothetical protein